MKTRGSRQVLLGVLAVAVVVLAWVLVRDIHAPSGPAGQGVTATYTLGPLGTDSESGLAWVAESALPPQAHDTLALIRAGGPFPYPRSDNQVFANRERLLPTHARGYYREFTVTTPGSGDRGARRIITGSRGEKYWTGDHYASFERIREGT